MEIKGIKLHIYIINKLLHNALNAVSCACRNFTDSCFLISLFLKDISGIFMAKINTKFLKIILNLGQDKLSFCLAKDGEI